MLKATLRLKVYSLLFPLMLKLSLLQFSSLLPVDNFQACGKEVSTCMCPSHLLCIFLKSMALLKKQHLLAGCLKKTYFFPRSYCSMHRLEWVSPGCHMALRNPAGLYPTLGPRSAGVKVLGSLGAPGWLPSPAGSRTPAALRSQHARAQRAESGGRAAAALWESHQNICDIWDCSRTRESEVDPGNLPIILMRMFPYRGRPFTHETGRLARGKGWSK